MSSRSSRNRIAGVFQILRILMAGKRLTVRDVLRQKLAPSDSAARRRLRVLAQEIPGVRRSDRRPRAWFFEWPEDRQARPSAVLAIQLAHSLLDFLGEGALGVELETLAREYAARLPGDRRRTVPDLSRMFFAKTRLLDPVGIDEDAIDRIATAMFDERCIEALYTHFDGERDRLRIEPYSVVFHDEGLYCVGKCLSSAKKNQIGEIRIYNIARFKKVRARESRPFRYPRPRRYDPRVLLANCIGIFLPPQGEEPEKIVLRFAKHWATYLRRHRWHETQSKPSRNPDGSRDVTFRLYLTQDLVRWILGFGKDVEVIEPERLRVMVSEQRGDPAETPEQPT